MRQVMVRYKVKPDRIADNEALVRAVYDELAESDPAGLHYATFKLEDGVTFIHIASITGEHNPLADVAAFAAFQQDLGDRCDEPPAPTELSEVGAFRFFGGS